MPVALVAGDRQTDGIFPLWSIAQNIGIRSLQAAASRARSSRRDLEAEFAEDWRQKIGIRTPRS